MTNYTWSISALDCAVSQDELENVVQTIHWRLKGENEEGITSEVYGANPVDAPNPESFSVYEELTQEVIVGWLENILDVKTLKQKIEAKIEAKINPITVTLPLFTSEIEQEEETDQL